jgi:ribonuclease P protein component
MDRLKKRSDFLRVQNNGNKWVSRGMILIVADNDIGKRRFGITVTKKLEKSAVRRNRMKRRLRAIAYDVLPDTARSSMDFILIARQDTSLRLYRDLKNDLEWCLEKLCVAKTKDDDW